MYRGTELASHAQIDGLRRELAGIEEEREALRVERDRARLELQRVRDGVDPDPALESDVGYRRARIALGVLGGTAALALVAAIVPLCASLVAPPHFTAEGVRNFVWHFEHGRGLVGLAAAGFVLVLASPWVLLPFLGRRGLRETKRWGWTFSVAGCALFLPTPLLPVAAVALTVLVSRRVRSVYFHA